MSASVSPCAEPISQPCQLKVKVTGQGYGFESWISCPLHISYTRGRIFFKLWSYVCLSETMCRTYNSTMPTQGQGNSSRSQVCLEFRVRSLSPIPMEGFSLNFGQMFTLVRRCAESITQPCRLKVKVTVQGHGFEHWISCLLCISFTLGGCSLNFGQMVTCGTICRIHNSAMGTQGQGDSSRSRVWALNCVSTRYLLYQWKDILLILSNVCLSEMICRTHGSPMQTHKVTLQGHGFEPWICVISFILWRIFSKLLFNCSS